MERWLKDSQRPLFQVRLTRGHGLSGAGLVGSVMPAHKLPLEKVIARNGVRL